MTLFSRPGFSVKSYTEAFYSHNLWGKIIDDCFRENFEVLRGEIGSNATRMKLNASFRVPTPHQPDTTPPGLLRQQSGPLADALFVDLEDRGGYPFEYGASECSREFGGECTIKFVEDRTKLIILLRDQLVFMNKWTKGSPEVLRNAQTVGFITHGKLSL